MVKITRPVASPVVEQEITISAGAVIAAGDLAWIVPLAVGGVNPIPAEGEKKPSVVHAAGVKISAMIQDAGAEGSVLSISVFSCESVGLPIAADSQEPKTLLGRFEVFLGQVLSNVNVPCP